MVLVGFIQQYEESPLFENYSSFKEKKFGEIKNSNIDIIEHYLKSAPIVFGWMHYFQDLDTGQLIAPHTYHTDGVWIWPSYLVYLLNRFGVEDSCVEFIEYIVAKKEIPEVSKENLKNAENQVMSMI